METRKMSIDFFFFTSLRMFLKYHSSRQKLGNYGATAALQAFPFATNGASARGFVSVRMRACVSLQDPAAVGTRNTAAVSFSNFEADALPLSEHFCMFVYSVPAG